MSINQPWLSIERNLTALIIFNLEIILCRITTGPDYDITSWQKRLLSDFIINLNKSHTIFSTSSYFIVQPLRITSQATKWINSCFVVLIQLAWILIISIHLSLSKLWVINSHRMAMQYFDLARLKMRELRELNAWLATERLGLSTEAVSSILAALFDGAFLISSSRYNYRNRWWWFWKLMQSRG